MLPDYPKVKMFIRKKFYSIVQSETRNDQLLSQIRFQRIHEGDAFSVRSIEGFMSDDFYKKIEAKFVVTKDEMINEGPEIYYNKAKEVAQQMIKQEAKDVLDKMEEVTQKTGNIVDAKSQPLSPDIIFQLMEKGEMDFDELGFPIYPTLILSPDLYEKVKSELQRWSSDPKVIARQKEIIDKKRKEWLDRESNRKLVD